MKKVLSLLVFLSFITCVDAQVIFSEDFDGVPGPTAGGAGTYVFPAGWLLRNVDNRTPAGGVSYVNEAWERREDFNFNVADSAAFSTSWYSPGGAADDWMWTPLIGPLPANCHLTWNAVAYDASYPDGYEVRIMTQSSTPGGPTGGTGVLGNQVSSSTQIFTVAAEAASWTSHNIDLSTYVGQSVWIGFRNSSNDQFLLLIDDIKIEAVVNYDASILSKTPLSEYTQTPFSLSPSFPLSAVIKNVGSSNITNVMLTVKVYDELDNIIFTDSSAKQATLTSNSNYNATTINQFFTPVAAGSYRVEYSASMTETDQITTNNMLEDSVMVSDTVYARDMGALVGTVGIGAGLVGYVGHEFLITDTVKLSSISMYLNGQSAGAKVGVSIFGFTNNKPDNIPIYIDTFPLASTINGFITIPIKDTALYLLPDTFVFCGVEIDSTLRLAQTVNKFTLGQTWVNWPTSPLGGWGNIEAFGGTFQKALVLRANLKDKCDGFAVSIIASEDTICSGNQVTLTGSGASNYSWSNGVTNGVPFSPTTTQTYTVTGTDTYGCLKTSSVIITVETCTNVNNLVTKGSAMEVYPNPNKGVFYVEIKENAILNVYNPLGKLIISEQVKPERHSFNLSEESNGIYILKVTGNNSVYVIKIIKE